jgi:hypothetical protein
MVEDYTKWKERIATEIESKNQSGFMDFVDCNSAWDNRHADEADEALDNLINLVRGKQSDAREISANIYILRKFIDRKRK